MVHASCPATLVADIDEHLSDGTPGAFSYYAMHGDPPDAPPAGPHFVRPCGCGAIGGVSFRGSRRPQWSYDGDREKPTCTPSILFTGGCPTRWHGFLTAGCFEGCAS